MVFITPCFRTWQDSTIIARIRKGRHLVTFHTQVLCSWVTEYLGISRNHAEGSEEKLKDVLKEKTKRKKKICSHALKRCKYFSSSLFENITLVKKWKLLYHFVSMYGFQWKRHYFLITSISRLLLGFTDSHFSVSLSI